jgi:hypothetical protein
MRSLARIQRYQRCQAEHVVGVNRGWIDEEVGRNRGAASEAKGLDLISSIRLPSTLCSSSKPQRSIRIGPRF